MHYLVFIPDCGPADLEQAAKIAGLTPFLGGHDVLTHVPGPNDKTGMMLGHLSPLNTSMNYRPNEQDWLPSVAKKEDGTPRYAVGIWKEKPPTESELRRAYTQKGPLTKLGDQRWILPTPDTVDARAVYADDWSMRWEVIRKFSWLCDEAKQLNQTYLEEFGQRSFVFRSEPSAQIEWLLKLLQINYRLLPEIAVYLDLWTGKDHILDTFLSTLGLFRKESSDG